MPRVNSRVIIERPNLRLVIAQVLSGAVFALFLIRLIAAPQFGMVGHPVATSAFGLFGSYAIHVPGLIAVALAAAAFVLSINKRSYLVAGLLSAAGIMEMIHLLPFLGDIVFPGPIVADIFGLAILGLGVAKAVGTARTAVAAAR